MKENKKVLMVYTYEMCEHIEYGVFLDIKEGKKFIETMNIPYNKSRELIDECDNCFIEGYTEDTDIFKNKDTCSRAYIKTDRYGKYCENRISDNEEIFYSGYEFPILDKD